MNQGLIIFAIIVLIIWTGVTIWLIIMIKRFVYKDNPLAGELLEIDRSLLGQPFQPIRVFIFSKTFYPEKEISETMYIVEIIKSSIIDPKSKHVYESVGSEIDEYIHTTVFYRIDMETFKLFSESGCKEFRLTSKVIKPGEDKLYFEPYVSMRDSFD